MLPEVQLGFVEHQPPAGAAAAAIERAVEMPASLDEALACRKAGRGLRKSSPSRISATLFSGAFSTSSYVARFMASRSGKKGTLPV